MIKLLLYIFLAPFYISFYIVCYAISIISGLFIGFFSKSNKKTKTKNSSIDINNQSTTIYDNDSDYNDPLYNEIVDYVIQAEKVSASLLQRKFRLGYNRAARMIDLLEERGIIGPQNGSKPREVLIETNEDCELKKNVFNHEETIQNLTKEEKERELLKQRREEIKAIKENYSDYLEWHDKLDEETGILYSVAINSEEMGDIIRCINACIEDIKIAPIIKEYYNKLESLTGKKEQHIYNSFKRLASIYELDGQFDEAINVCNQAIEVGFSRDGTSGQMYGRVARLKKKLKNNTIVKEDSNKKSFNEYVKTGNK